MSVRMKDLARDLGLSIVTISKVLRNHPDIGEATRQRVQQRIKELDYRPNAVARSLVTGRSYLIGFIVPDLLHPFFAEVAQALSGELRKAGYYLIISASEEDPGLEEREVEQLLSRRLDALILASSRSTVDLFFRIEKANTPYILIDRSFPGITANFVGADDESIGILATEHLIQIGCKHVAHIRGPENSPGRGRLAGYRKALAQAGRPLFDDYVAFGQMVDKDSKQSGADAMRQLLNLKIRPDGVFCYNDPLAMGVMDCVLQMGLRIPEDIAVIGCGNLHYDTSLAVPLSSVDQNSRGIGEETARLVLGILKAKTVPPPESVILKPTLIVRASTMKQAPRRTPPVTKNGTRDRKVKTAMAE
jgi:LacI family transcriptional regulator